MFLDQNVYLNVYYEKEKSPETRWFQGFAVVRSTGLEPICLFFDGVNRFRNRVNSGPWELIFMHL